MALDYLYVYGDADTKKQLWRFYPVYTMALPLPPPEDYSSPSLFQGKADDDQICSVCLDFFIQQGEAVKTPCGHLCCASCLKDALTWQTNCPKCQQETELPSSLTMEKLFSEAAKAGDLYGLSLLLGLGVDINQQDPMTTTTLPCTWLIVISTAKPLPFYREKARTPAFRTEQVCDL